MSIDLEVLEASSTKMIADGLTMIKDINTNLPPRWMYLNASIDIEIQYGGHTLPKYLNSSFDLDF